MSTRRSRLGWAMAACIVSAWAVPAVAQTVYRCGPDGSSYSHRPCPGGRTVSADDARTLSQRSEAEAALGRQAAAATSLERQRLRDETLAARTGPAGFRTAPVNPEASRPPGSKQSARVSTKVVKRAPAKAAKPRPPQAVRAG